MGEVMPLSIIGELVTSHGNGSDACLGHQTWRFFFRIKLGMSKHHNVFKMDLMTMSTKKTYHIPAAFWDHHCTWNMIIFGAGVVITTKSCPRKLASAAFQP
jgi:hypothetical protein